MSSGIPAIHDAEGLGGLAQVEEAAAPIVRFETGPGEQMQVDGAVIPAIQIAALQSTLRVFRAEAANQWQDVVAVVSPRILLRARYARHNLI